MVANHRQTRLESAHAKIVGIVKAAKITIQTEIHFGLTFKVRRNVIAMGPKSRTFRIVFPFQANKLVQSDQLLLRVNAPDAGRRGRGFEVWGQWSKEQIVIQMIALAGTQVVDEPAFILHHRGQLIGDPRRKLPTLHQWRLVRLLPRWHFLQRYLFPDSLPQTGVFDRNIAEPLQ